MKENKKYFIIGGLLIIAIIAIISLLVYVNNNEYSYSFSEKSFINSHSNKVIDVNMEGSLPIFSSNGEGVFYDFLNDMEKSTGLTFNVNINNDGAYNFVNKNLLGKGDIVFYTDHFVIVSTLGDRVTDLSKLNGQNVAVISEDKEYVANYLNGYNIVFNSFDHLEDLVSQMGRDVVYAALPMQKYINSIVYNKYNIVYHLEGLHSHYVLSMKENNTMSNIFVKTFNKWQDKIYNSINTHFLNLYYKVNNISEIDRERITSDDLIVGYIDNMPFEGKVNREFSGITDEYLSKFSDMTGATYKYIKYDNIKEFNKALSNKKIDIALNYYNVKNNNYVDSTSLGNIEYVIVASHKNHSGVSNLVSVKDDVVKMIGSTNLTSYIISKGIDVKSYKNYKSMFDDISENDILIIEKSVYDFYKNSDLKNYVIKYIGEANISNTFLLNNSNNILNKLFNFYISTIGIKNMNHMAISNSLEDVSTNLIIEFIFSNIVYIVFALVAGFLLIFKFNKKIKVTKKIKKEDKMMYLDVMTNLKNRNYLNDNLAYWEENKIYPQAVVIVDLNSIAVINDTKGHEEGDKQIQSAAGILIKTQRENSEIIRTDGNEFLIYLVGYEESKIVTYVNKLVKEFKNLPYEYGASIGYFMITSESTSVDDAIIEAVNNMRKNKGV